MLRTLVSHHCFHHLFIFFVVFIIILSHTGQVLIPIFFVVSFRFCFLFCCFFFFVLC